MRRRVRERIPVVGPIDLHRTAGFLHAANGPDLRFTEGGLRACVRAGAGHAVVELEPAAGGVDATLSLGPGADAPAALGAARQLAGLPRDPHRSDELPAFTRRARADAGMAPALRACRGLRLPQHADPAAALVAAILAQQVTTGFAAELGRRVRLQWGEAVRMDGEDWLLPAPAARLADVEPAPMRVLQVSQRKAEYIRDLSRELADGTLDLAGLAALPAAEASAALVARRGIGETTAAWLLAFASGHPDAWPPADVGLWRALDALHGARTGARIERWLAGYAGVRSLLAVHLWEAMRAKALSSGGPARTEAADHR